MVATQNVEQHATVTPAVPQPDPDLVLGCDLFRECPRTADWLAIVNCHKPSPKPTCEHHRKQLVNLLQYPKASTPTPTVQFSQDLTAEGELSHGKTFNARERPHLV